MKVPEGYYIVVNILLDCYADCSTYVIIKKLFDIEK